MSQHYACLCEECQTISDRFVLKKYIIALWESGNEGSKGETKRKRKKARKKEGEKREEREDIVVVSLGAVENAQPRALGPTLITVMGTDPS